MIKLVPIQNIFCSKDDETKICSFDDEIVSKPTTPLIHPMSRIWLILDGDGKLLLNNRSFNLSKGSLVSVLPWQITEISEVHSTLRFFVVAYYFDNINEIIKTFYNPGRHNLSVVQTLSQSPVLSLNDAEFSEMQHLFWQIRDELHTQSVQEISSASNSLQLRGLSNLYITNKLIEIIVSLIRSGQMHPMPSATIDASEILHFLYTHLNEKITLSMLSQKFYMSESAISSYLNKTTGLSFFDLLNEIRIGKTISYLLYTDLTLEELAEILGFVDSAHISKVFLARIGMKANDFRKTYQSVGNMCHIKDRQIFYSVVSYIYRNYAENLQLNTVSQQFHISPKELNQILLFQVEKSFNDYLNFIRVNRASELLLQTNKSILTIALEVGYHNEKTLARNFLHYRSITPGNFRRNIELQKTQL